MVVLRDKKEQTVTLKLPERKRGELRKESFENFNVDVDLDGFDPAAFQKQFVAKFDQKQVKEFQKAMEKFSKEMEKKFWADLQERLDDVKQNTLPYKYQQPELWWRSLRKATGSDFDPSQDFGPKPLE